MTDDLTALWSAMEFDYKLKSALKVQSKVIHSVFTMALNR